MAEAELQELESGVLAGLIESGVGLELADRIIGTSAGSFVGAVLANGYDMRTYYYELNERRDDSDHATLSSDLSVMAECIYRRT